MSKKKNLKRNTKKIPIQLPKYRICIKSSIKEALQIQKFSNFQMQSILKTSFVIFKARSRSTKTNYACSFDHLFKFLFNLSFRNGLYEAFFINDYFSSFVLSSPQESSNNSLTRSSDIELQSPLSEEQFGSCADELISIS